MAIDIDKLIADAKAYRESIEPVDVQVALGRQVVTVRIPYLMPEDFNLLADMHSPHPAYREPSGAWFSLAGVTRSHPHVVLVDKDGNEDDLLIVRDREVYYRWPDVYDLISADDRESLHAAVWGLYVYEGRKLKREAEDG